MHAVVIGAGSGGLTAAIGLKGVGFTVTVVEAEHIGGDCTNYGCIPSKTLIHHAQKIADIRNAGIVPSQKQIDEAAQSAKRKVEEFQHEETPEWLESYGIKVKQGWAQFKDSHTLIVSKEEDEEEISFDFCVIATGSSTFIPAIDGIEDVHYLTNKTIFDLPTPPKSLGIIGNGVIASELGQAYSNLGSKVTIFGRGNKMAPALATKEQDILHNTLISQGIKYVSESVESCTVKEMKSKEVQVKTNQSYFVFDVILMATGRKPNLPNGLDAAGITHSKKGISINSKGQTSQKHIYAVGDCAENLPNFTHFANYMAKAVVMNIAIKGYTKILPGFSKISSDGNPAVIFTNPEIATVGPSYEDIKEMRFAKEYIQEFDHNDRARTHNESGYISIRTVGFRGRIVGVSIVGERAGDMLSEFQYHIQNRTSILKLGSIIRAYPTYGAPFERIGREHMRNMIGAITGIFKRK